MFNRFILWVTNKLIEKELPTRAKACSSLPLYFSTLVLHNILKDRNIEAFDIPDSFIISEPEAKKAIEVYNSSGKIGLMKYKVYEDDECIFTWGRDTYSLMRFEEKR